MSDDQDYKADPSDLLKYLPTDSGEASVSHAVAHSIEKYRPCLEKLAAESGEASVSAPTRQKIDLEVEMETDGRWIAEFHHSPGCLAYGATPSEAIMNAARILAEVSAPAPTPTQLDIDAKWLKLYAELRESECGCNIADKSKPVGTSLNYTCEWCLRHPEGDWDHVESALRELGLPTDPEEWWSVAASEVQPTDERAAGYQLVRNHLRYPHRP